MAKKQREEKKLTGVKFVSPPFRLSFPHLFEPHKAPKAKEPKYSLSGLIPKDDEETKKFLHKKLIRAAKECWGEDKTKWPKINWPWRDGDDKSDMTGYEGHWYFGADSSNPPGVVDRKANDIINERDIYAGCYVRAELVAKAIPEVGTDDSGKPRNFVKFYLQHVMFWEDGEKLGGGGDAKNAFKEFAEDDDSDDGDEDEDFDLDW